MTESCRLITTEQYQEYLKLKEEHKPLSWEELKEEAKKMGAAVWANGEVFCVFNVHFCKDGCIYVAISYYDKGWDSWKCDTRTIATDRDYTQMLAIMKALQ